MKSLEIRVISMELNNFEISYTIFWSVKSLGFQRFYLRFRDHGRSQRFRERFGILNKIRDSNWDSTEGIRDSSPWRTPCMYVYVNHAHLYNIGPPPCYLTTAVLNDCYSEVTAYTVRAYSTLVWLVCYPQRVWMLTPRPLTILTTAAIWKP